MVNQDLPESFRFVAFTDCCVVLRFYQVFVDGIAELMVLSLIAFGSNHSPRALYANVMNICKCLEVSCPF